MTYIRSKRTNRRNESGKMRRRVLKTFTQIPKRFWDSSTDTPVLRNYEYNYTINGMKRSGNKIILIWSLDRSPISTNYYSNETTDYLTYTLKI